MKTKHSFFSLSPTNIIVISFAMLIAVGALFLSMPYSSANGISAGFVDSLFTATSATCVTGLVIADTATKWSLAGQFIILILIQCGGLGITTLATFFFAASGHRLSYRGMLTARESVGGMGIEGITRLLRTIILTTFGIEAAGALLLMIGFVPRFGAANGIYMSIFHSVSAFCNAGFDIMGASFGQYNGFAGFAGDPVFSLVIPALIITGGLGFIVWNDIFSYRKNRSLMLHTRLVLIITAILISSGFVLFLLFEYNNPSTLGGMGILEKISAAFFQSVTSRTAGFNTISTAGLREISLLLTMLLMFIGAAPGSTGGGVKVTTFGILLYAVVCQIRGRKETVIMKHRVHSSVVSRALAIFALSISLVIAITVILMLTEKNTLIQTLFEAVSAFGTVGLSTGITPGLSPAGKIILSAVMYLGRIGPLTFAVSVAMKSSRKDEATIYPEGKVAVG